jgi:DNA-binding beta-propeller fold protein YncE
MPDRREFLADALQVLAGWVGASHVADAGGGRGGRGGGGGAPPRALRALVTADTEAHVAVVSLATHRVIARIKTLEGPRSIQATGHGRALVGHAGAGAVTLIEDGRVRRVLHGFGQPRYAAVHGNRAYVSDGATGEVAVLDLARARVLSRVAVGDGARHITIDPAGRTIWVALGSSANQIAIVDLAGWRVRRVTPPFLAHDVAFTPSGNHVWVTAGREPRTAVYTRDKAEPVRLFDGDEAPQHVTFGPTNAYLASGEGAVVTVRSLRDQRILRKTKVPFGSYNVQRGAGHVLTPSLGTGALTILDPRGRISAQIDVARNAHDVCIA